MDCMRGAKAVDMEAIWATCKSGSQPILSALLAVDTNATDLLLINYSDICHCLGFCALVVDLQSFFGWATKIDPWWIGR